MKTFISRVRQCSDGTMDRFFFCLTDSQSSLLVVVAAIKTSFAEGQQYPLGMDFVAVVEFRPGIYRVPTSLEVLSVMLANELEYEDYITFYVWTEFLDDILYDVNRVIFTW